MNWLWDTISGRTILVLVAGIFLSLAVSQYLHQRGLEREAHEATAVRLADRLITLRQTIARFPQDQRDEVAHSFSGGAIDVHWSPEPLAIARVDSTQLFPRLRQILMERHPDLGGDRLIIGTNPAGDSGAEGAHTRDHITLISLPMDDGSWLNMSVAQVTTRNLASPSYWATTLLLLAAIGILAVLMGRWLTKPLTHVADGARQLFAGGQSIDVPEQGTREVRELAVAFNEMQARIKRLVSDRTDMLAAISHDLRTPLTRLRLRAESMSEAALKSSVVADLDEMEAMLDATLAFLRGDRSEEQSRTLDVGAILQSIASDCEDAGADVSLTCDSDLVVVGRPLALKRAFTNVIQNAIRHGGSAEIKATVTDKALSITIADQGPGIPAEQLDAVFSPFIRGEPSRNRQPGGHGLGLTVARSLLRMHGGDVSLQNRSAGGLLATIVLPVT
jgi:two-component system OmpR family sensor kinase